MPKLIIMKKISTVFFAAAALFLASCSEEPVTYSLEEGTLGWMGQENADHMHTGILTVTKGALTMQGEDVVDGKFTIDMVDIEITSEGLPAEKVAYLKGHLQGEDFFLVEKFPTVEVDVTGYKDGKLNTTIHVLGAEMKQDIPVKLEKKEGEVSINGHFSVDMSASKIPYLKEINEETGKPALNPNFEFDLNLKLKK